MEKKILISTVDCWSVFNSANTASTFMSLFKNWKQDNLASIYFRDDVPSSDQCCLYFEISESAIIKSVLIPKVKTGTLYCGSRIIVARRNKKQIEETQSRYRKFSFRRNYLLIWLRELLWLVGKWRSKELNQFLEEFKPDIIIFGMEGYRYFNRINRYIIKKTGAKAIGFFWDDNFTYLQKKRTLGFLINRFLQRRSLKKTVAMCDAFFAISPKTKKEADNFFGIKCDILTKPVDYITKDVCEVERLGVIKVVYTGNLKIGRLDALQVISDVLVKNPDLEEKFSFEIYSSTEVPDRIKENMSKEIHFHGSVPLYEIPGIQKTADVLLLLEDITGDNQKIARLSFSTKIVDYLAQGKCILAVANPEVASTEYLKEHDCAICVDSAENIKVSLKRLVDSPDIIRRMGDNAIRIAKENHSRKVIENRLFKAIERIYYEDSVN